MRTRIAIDCLNCDHFATMAESSLPEFGLEENTSLVVLTKKLRCKVCGSKAVRAFRFEDDDEQRETLHESPSIIPKKLT